MITFSKLGRKGRLGNQLFQIASTAGIARKNNHSFFFPHWDYQNYFDYNFPTGQPDKSFKRLKEQKFAYHDWKIDNENYDLDGWLQSELYFDAALTKKMFSFEPSFKQSVLQRDKKLFNRNTILISVRRGDFVHSDLYFQLPFKYYLLVLFKYFPGWEQSNLIFASDDIEFCKYHYGHLENAFFLEDRTPVEQIVIGANCDDFIISNSTFSWWIAWLGEEEESKVICPIKNFRGRFYHPSDKDFYPERWIKFDHRYNFLPMNYFSLSLKSNLMQSKSLFKFKLKRLKKKISKLLSPTR